MSSGRVAMQMANPYGAPPPLTRTNTAPVYQTRTNTESVHGLSQTMSHSSRSSQVSGTTALTSASTTSLSSTNTSATSIQPPSNGQVIATNNIINQRADASRSLYQICVNLIQRLAQVPDFDRHLSDLDNNAEDPVTALWSCLRKGTPLLTIYNSLQPSEPLRIDDSVSEAKRPKFAAFKFYEACLKELKIPSEDCFALTDLFGDDTTGFVKVTQVINFVLDKAGEKGLLLKTGTNEATQSNAAPGSQMSYRDHVVRELVDTERKYVQDLENLHELKRVIEQKGVIPGDVVHDIFLNINAILDFQRRFLIRIETTNSQADSKQEWGQPFVTHEESFGIYEPFIANQRKAASVAMREFDKITKADHPVVVDFNTLDGFLLKPMQRLVKYPLLLKEIRDKTGADEETKADLTAGIQAANRVLKQANDAVDRELRGEALIDLVNRVDDWKNHRVDHFGELLLHGHFPVITGKSDIPKEYSIYLFERILLCCKELNPNKSKDKLMGGQKDKKAKMDKKREPNKNAKLQLKGRIFMTNVTEVLSLSKQGSYQVQIFWKGDPGVENFIVRFSNEEMMKKWYNGIDAQRKEHATVLGAASPDAQPTEFAWMRDQTPNIPNPYAQDDDDDDDDEPPPPTQSEMPRNLSNTNLRARSITESSQSLSGIVKGPPPRFPMAVGPPLSLQTQPIPSPGQRGGDSYFSPVAESPASSRSSATPSMNNMYPFPRQGTPKGSWDENMRYTAPALARVPSRESQNSLNASFNAYQMNGRTPQRPSLPAMASQSSQNNAAAQRSRSYSTPDINAQTGGRRLPSGGGSVPAVPGIPAHLHPAYDNSIPRSQTNSPNSLPLRANTQSPGIQRERLAQANQYNAPGYTRSNSSQIPMSSADSRGMSPPLVNQTAGDGDLPLPTQLKVKVNCDGNYVTLVVPFNITYQSLIDRIDAKIGRFSTSAIAKGTMRLRYRDEDGDFVTIESDDDIQIAFQEWREAQKQQYHNGQLGEIELFCLSARSWDSKAAQPATLYPADAQQAGILEVSRDSFAPPPHRVARAWEKVPVAARTPRLNGHKIWKKRGGKSQKDKENHYDGDAGAELEKEGAGSRKRVRILGVKENIGNAPWKKIEHSPNNTRAILAEKNANTVFQPDEPTDLCGNDSKNDVEVNSSKPMQFVPRKRTNTNHVITPKKALRQAISNAQPIVMKSPSKDRRRKSTRRSLRRLTIDRTSGLDQIQTPEECAIVRSTPEQIGVPELSSALPQKLVDVNGEEQQTLEEAIEATVESSSVESTIETPQKQERKSQRRSSRRIGQASRSSITTPEAQAEARSPDIESSLGSDGGAQNANAIDDGEIKTLNEPAYSPVSDNPDEEVIEQTSLLVQYESDTPSPSDSALLLPVELELSCSPVPTRCETISSPHQEAADQDVNTDVSLISSDHGESVDFTSLNTDCSPDRDLGPDSPSLEVEEEPNDVSETSDEESVAESEEYTETLNDFVNDMSPINKSTTSEMTVNETPERELDTTTSLFDDDNNHDDADMNLLNDFLARMKAAKEAKGKKEVTKRKSSAPSSPMSIIMDVIMANQIPESPEAQEFDMSSSPSSKKRSKRSKAATSEDENGEAQSTRRSGRTRIPVVKPPPSAPSFIPVRRLGQDSENVAALRKDDEKHVATLTRVNTRKNKADSVPAVEVLVRMAVEKQLLRIDPAFRELKEMKETYEQEKEKEKQKQKTQKSQKNKAKTVTWAERLEDFQTTESRTETGKDKGGKVETKKTAVKVGVRSSKIARVPPVNGTPVSKRRAKGRS
ncbi:hypothetical protein B7463_g12238, partial [Scytalidium lignicola]